MLLTFGVIENVLGFLLVLGWLLLVIQDLPLESLLLLCQGHLLLLRRRLVVGIVERVDEVVLVIVVSVQPSKQSVIIKTKAVSNFIR